MATDYSQLIARLLDGDWLFARTTQRDDCLQWRLAAAHGTDPQARIGGGRNGACVLVRRALWELVNERPFPRNAIARCTCDTPLCVHPDHIIAMPKRQVLTGRSLTLTHRAHIAASRRAASALSDADVDAIRNSSDTLSAAAARYGIVPTYVSHIRIGKRRSDYRNPFLQLATTHAETSPQRSRACK